MLQHRDEDGDSYGQQRAGLRFARESMYPDTMVEFNLNLK
jgi:hypothetical protein